MEFKDPFEIEKARNILAKSGDFKGLVRLYSKKFPEIPDLNSPDFWNLKLSSKNTDENGHMARDRIDVVYQEVKGHKGEFLDVGFGNGELEQKLQGTSLKLQGIDISPYAAKKASGNLNGKFLLGDILHLPFPNNKFDIVVSLEVLEHIPPFRTFRALKELWRVLKVEGLAIVSVPLNEGLKTMIERGENPNAHVRVYTPTLIEAELKISGFDIRKKIFLFAFSSFYSLKKILQKRILKNRWKPNNIIVFAEK